MKRVLGLLALLAAPAAADDVILRNGAVFSGIVSEQGDKVVVQMDYGTMSFRKIDVRDIRRSDDPLKELEKKVEAATTPQQTFEAALWARDKGLAGKSNEICEKLILLDPNHEGARTLLGYERHEGAWLRGDDLLRARGFVRRDGEWMRRETAEQLLLQEKSFERERLRVERQGQEDGRDVELRRLAVEQNRVETEKELELQRLQVERERIEAERDRRQWGIWWVGAYRTPATSLIVLPGDCGPAPHPGYGPGRTLPPPQDRPYPGWTQPLLTPPSLKTQGGPPVKAK